MPYVPIAQDLSGHGLQRRLGVTGIRNSLIPVTANFRSVISSSLSTIVEKARNLPKRVLMTKGS